MFSTGVFSFMILRRRFWARALRACVRARARAPRGHGVVCAWRFQGAAVPPPPRPVVHTGQLRLTESETIMSVDVTVRLSVSP